MKAKRPPAAPPKEAAPPKIPQPPPVSKLETLSAGTGLINHFINPPPLPPMPWEMPFELRQRMSKDPRTVKHLADIDRWNNTPLQHVWARIRAFAEAKKDWVMTRWDLIAWLKSEGITSEIVLDRLADVLEAKEEGTVRAIAASTLHSPPSAVASQSPPPFVSAFSRPTSTSNEPSSPASRGNSATRGVSGAPSSPAGGGGSGPRRSFGNAKDKEAPKVLTFREKELLAKHNAQRFNAIIICKYFELALTSSPYDDLFIQHCFDQFDRPLGSVRLSKATILHSDVKPLPVGKKGKKGGKASPARSLSSTTGAESAGRESSVSSSASPIRPSSSSGRGSTPRRGGKRKTKGTFKMANGATFAMIEPLRKMILRGEFDLTKNTEEKEGNTVGGAAAPASPAVLPPINGSHQDQRNPSVAFASSVNAASPSSAIGGCGVGGQLRPTIGFSSLNMQEMHPMVAHHARRTRPALGHTEGFTHSVLFAMRRNYDTVVLPSPLPPPPPSAAAAAAPSPVQNPIDVIGSALHGSNGHKFHLPSAPTYEAILGSADAVENTPNARPISDDDITYEMFKYAFLSGRNSEWVATFMLPILECAMKYFAPPHGELPLVSLRWLRDISAVPVSDVQYDADAELLKEIEELGCDPWLASFKKPKRSAAAGKGKGSPKRR